eukprot:3375141-Rhodomonas_salina.2
MSLCSARLGWKHILSCLCGVTDAFLALNRPFFDGAGIPHSHSVPAGAFLTAGVPGYPGYSCSSAGIPCVCGPGIPAARSTEESLVQALCFH